MHDTSSSFFFCVRQPVSAERAATHDWVGFVGIPESLSDVCVCVCCHFFAGKEQIKDMIPCWFQDDIFLLSGQAKKRPTSCYRYTLANRWPYEESPRGNLSPFLHTFFRFSGVMSLRKLKNTPSHMQPKGKQATDSNVVAKLR